MIVCVPYRRYDNVIGEVTPHHIYLRLKNVEKWIYILYWLCFKVARSSVIFYLPGSSSGIRLEDMVRIKGRLIRLLRTFFGNITRVNTESRASRLPISTFVTCLSYGTYCIWFASFTFKINVRIARRRQKISTSLPSLFPVCYYLSSFREQRVKCDARARLYDSSFCCPNTVYTVY